MKSIILLFCLFIIGGCASHANIQMPAVTQVYNNAFTNKTFGYEILYSQPKPGIFSGGDKMPLLPLEKSEMSIASAATLKNLPDYIYKQLPSSVIRDQSGNGDFKLIVELTAYNKKGPAYSDYEFGKSFGKNLLTFGLASSEYNIVANFNAKYRLISSGKEIFSKNYKVNESVDHERGDFDSFNTLNDYSGQLLEKHLILTLNDFFKEAAANM